ncbi:hypothetical protein NYV49_11515 [Escherichia coli]|nr:hypothetical protein [Escherichia coli]
MAVVWNWLLPPISVWHYQKPGCSAAADGSTGERTGTDQNRAGDSAAGAGTAGEGIAVASTLEALAGAFSATTEDAHEGSQA